MSHEESKERVMSGAAWADFCDKLKAAGAVIQGETTPDDPFDRAEGYRYLSRLTRAALETFIEHADPAAPALHRPVHETAKIGADNPDNYYQRAAVSGDYEYRLRGKRGTVNYLGFGVQSPGVAQTGNSSQSAYLEAADLEIAKDGTFEIVLSEQAHPGNWLRLTPESDSLIVRQTFLDRENELPAELVLERIGASEKPQPLTALKLDKGLGAAGNLVISCSALFANWVHGFKSHTNQLPKFDDSVSIGAGGDPNICYYHSYWELGLEEALVIEATPPECDSWNFQLNNYWMESLDYRFHTIHVNKHTARYREDGSVQIVVAHQDPGVDNWIDTAGHARGTMCFRWIGAAHHPQPQTRVVKLAEL